MKKRILAIDYGRVRLGLARSDLMQIIASPLKILKAAKNPELTADLILAECPSTEYEAVVLGLPLKLSGEESPMSLEVRKLGEILEAKSDLKVIYWDERLTSKQVDSSMRADNVKRKKRDALSDTLSATLILQSYLSSL